MSRSALIVLVLLMLSGWYVFTQQVVRDDAYWQQRLTHVGATQMYSEFVSYVRTQPERTQHLMAHKVGELIYSREGEKGVAVCDNSFGFGCYHGLFGRAIAEGGVEDIARLDAACVEAYGVGGVGCQHGIGHGILEYVGYDDLANALSLCERTTQSAPLLGCVSGVFMEYNSPLVSDGELLFSAPRDFSPERPYEPCTEVSEQYRPSCHFELSVWMSGVLSGGIVEAGRYCEATAGVERTSCFLGIGWRAAFEAGYTVTPARMTCATFSPEDELVCRAGASWALYADPENRAMAPEVCMYTEDDAAHARCTSLADFTQASHLETI